MIPHHDRTDGTAGKKSSRYSEPTVALRAPVGSTDSARVGEPPPATRALAVRTSQDRRERATLRQGHDRPEGQWGTVGVVAIRDPADRMAQDLHRRLGDMLVIVCRAGLPQVLQLPGLLSAGLNIPASA
jgi:hypothetical protein